MGASSQWVLRRYAFGEVEDRIAKRVETPVLMLRKITRPHARSSEEVLLPGADPERAGKGRGI
jgi:hypothetical protein